MKKQLLLLSLAIGLVLASCTTSRVTKQMNQYMGLSKREVIMTFGKPDFDGWIDGAGKCIGYSTYRLVLGNPTYENRTFFLDADNKVIAWRFKRDPVPVDRIEFIDRTWRPLNN